MPTPTTPAHGPISSSSSSGFSLSGLFSTPAKAPLHDVDMNEVSVEMEDSPLVGNVSVEMTFGGDVGEEVEHGRGQVQVQAPVTTSTPAPAPAPATKSTPGRAQQPPAAAPRKTNARSGRATVEEEEEEEEEGTGALSLGRPRSQYEDESVTSLRGKSNGGRGVVNTNNHYTLHLSDGYVGKNKGSEAPFVLLGCVFLSSWDG